MSILTVVSWWLLAYFLGGDIAQVASPNAKASRVKGNGEHGLVAAMLAPTGGLPTSSLRVYLGKVEWRLRIDRERLTFSLLHGPELDINNVAAAWMMSDPAHAKKSLLEYVEIDDRGVSETRNIEVEGWGLALAPTSMRALFVGGDDRQLRVVDLATQVVNNVVCVPDGMSIAKACWLGENAFLIAKRYGGLNDRFAKCDIVVVDERGASKTLVEGVPIWALASSADGKTIMSLEPEKKPSGPWLPKLIARRIDVATQQALESLVEAVQPWATPAVSNKGTAYVVSGSRLMAFVSEGNKLKCEPVETPAQSPCFVVAAYGGEKGLVIVLQDYTVWRGKCIGTDTRFEWSRVDLPTGPAIRRDPSSPQ